MTASVHSDAGLRGTLDATTADDAVLQATPDLFDSNCNLAIAEDARITFARVINLSAASWLRVWLKDAEVANGNVAGGWLIAPLGSLDVPMRNQAASVSRLQVAGKVSSAVDAALAVATLQIQATFQRRF